MADNLALTEAKQNQNDEFYTQIVDIENEMRHYEPHFEGRTVYCNCDDPYESNFFKYFAGNFNHLGLKRLITTSYAGSAVTGEQLSLDDIEGLKPTESETARERVAYWADIRGVSDLDGDGRIGLGDVEYMLRHDANTVERLQDNGDFRSPECVALLEEADIVVTNPPFSLFREYLAQLIDHGKKFLILGQQNAITYKEVFPLIKDGKVWLGVNNGGDKWFQVPDDYDIKTESRKKIVDGVQYFSMGSVNWFTNLDHSRRHEELTLGRRYTPEKYPHYDNYEAIEVGKVADIPGDWEGVMGVPITFLDKYNPEQFEIVGITKTWFGASTKTYPKQVQVSASGKRSDVTKLNDGAAVQIEGPIEKTYYVVGEKHYEQKYARILIRRKDTGAM